MSAPLALRLNEDERERLLEAASLIDGVGHSYERRMGEEVNKRVLTMLAVLSLKLREMDERK